MTVDEFVEWCAARDDDERWELVDGVPVRMMAPQTPRHTDAKGFIWNEFRRAIATAGLSCRAFLDGVGTKIGEYTSRIPDVSVQCEPMDDDAVWLTAPIVLVEVVSRGSVTRDGRDKLIEYFGLPSVEHYLLVYPERRTVVHHQRKASSRDIATRIVEEGEIELSPPGFSVVVSSFFEDETFRPSTI
ncbi:Uma2 family endonuclease [Aureimonas leprariae]|nr:Uma2 family endonuclease [Aureimonas leprariae]